MIFVVIVDGKMPTFTLSFMKTIWFQLISPNISHCFDIPWSRNQIRIMEFNQTPKIPAVILRKSSREKQQRSEVYLSNTSSLFCNSTCSMLDARWCSFHGTTAAKNFLKDRQVSRKKDGNCLPDERTCKMMHQNRQYFSAKRLLPRI